MALPNEPGLLRRMLRAPFATPGRRAALGLLLIGLVVGATSVIGTQVALAVTGTDEFCGTACHSHEKFVYPDHKASPHYSNRTGVRAMCTDCHVPHTYPAKLIYKAKAGIKDAFAEVQGVIATQEKFDRERWRMANVVWEEMRENNSANCRSCHDDKAWNNKKQSEDAVKAHRKFLSGKATCIDCHTGVAHKEPEEPKAAAKPEASSAAASEAAPASAPEAKPASAP